MVENLIHLFMRVTFLERKKKRKECDVKSNYHVGLVKTRMVRGTSWGLHCLDFREQNQLFRQSKISRV